MADTKVSQVGTARKTRLVWRREAVASAVTSGVLAIGVAAGLGVLGIAAVDRATGPEPLVQVELPACPTEDSTNCHWDGSERGSGQGRSFVDVDGVTYFLGEDPPVTVPRCTDAIADARGVCWGEP